MERKLFEELLKWKNRKNRKPLIIKGARQTGKTYLIREFGKRCFETYHYFNFEENPMLSKAFSHSLSPELIIRELSFLVDSPIDPFRDLIIFDEIQREPKALTALKYFCEQLPLSYVCSAGSLLGLEMNKDSFPVGKVEFMHLKPMDFTEFINASGINILIDMLMTHDLKMPLPNLAHNRLIELWKHYLITGGLPEIVKLYIDRIITDSPDEYYGLNKNDTGNAFRTTKILSIFEDIRKLQRDLIVAYLADMAKHSGKSNSVHIEQVFRSVPNQLSKNIDETSKRYVFKDVIPGIRNYRRLENPIRWLEKAELIIKLPIISNIEIPLISQGKENIFKLYFFDIGLIGALSGLKPADIMKYESSIFKGFFIENYVAQQLTASGINELFCWQGRTSEIEFIFRTFTGNIVPIEVKSNISTKSKSMSVFIEKYNPDYSIILSCRNEGQKRKRWYIPLYLAVRLKELYRS